jgi:DNA-binding Lrp family transcriptional regulator
MRRGSPRRSRIATLAPIRRTGRLARRGRPVGKARSLLDPLDEAILEVLQRDGRASLRRVARQVRASVTTVSTRVRRMGRLGVLQGFLPLVSVRRLSEIGRGPHCLLLLVRPRDDRPGGRDRVARWMARCRQICYVFELSSSPELLALASTRSPAESRTLVERLRDRADVARVRPLPVSKVHKERPQHPLGEVPGPSVPLGTQEASVPG